MQPITGERFDAVLFDLDGVLTATARIHSLAWKTMFDEFLAWRERETGEAQPPFDVVGDYLPYVDGKPRLDGVRGFLESRGIELPEGGPGDPAQASTVHGLGNRKNQLVLQAIAAGQVEIYEGSVAFVRRLRELGIRTAVVSSSKNCSAVLEAAGIADLFELRIDGLIAAELGLPGKPAPDTFLEAARRIGVEPRRAVVVEDAISGVEAGRRGGFGLVIGVAREGNVDELRRHGADLVVRDLAELPAPGPAKPE